MRKTSSPGELLRNRRYDKHMSDARMKSGFWRRSLLAATEEEEEEGR